VARKIMIWVSFGVAAILGVIGILMYLGTMKPITIAGNAAIMSIDMIVASLLIGLGPYGFYQNSKMKRISQMDSKFPDFLRDLSESKRAGMTLTNALLTTAKGRYGALTEEIRKMASQITWGVSFVEALKLFGERVRTPLIERSVSLIIEASNSGGNVVEILKAAADDAREIKQIQAERKQNMGIYVIIIYLAFLVFIAVIEIMYSQFIPQIYKAVSGVAPGTSIGGMTFAPFDIETYKTLFFHAALIQGIGGGLVAGVMEEGKAIMGLRHAFIMIIISYLAFRFVVV
ncbi:MAG: type II secretion system F family protein, partial [Candidatus Thermoplasmatota archaeon]|nr:type II secretion system F family protein [Candidatus Thermoplasmatota archaeon]